MVYKPILVPTDLSDPSNQALCDAFEEAELPHAALTWLHVLPHEVTPEAYDGHSAPEARVGRRKLPWVRADLPWNLAAHCPCPKPLYPKPYGAIPDEEAWEKRRE